MRLLAWSRYDGNDYRVQVSRFDGATWAAPAAVGVPGSVDPIFDDAERPVLVYRRAVPRGWTVVELESAVAPEAHPSITVVRQAEIAGARRPVVSEVTAEGALLLWQGGQKLTVAWQPAAAARR